MAYNNIAWYRRCNVKEGKLQVAAQKLLSYVLRLDLPCSMDRRTATELNESICFKARMLELDTSAFARGDETASAGSTA